MKEISDIEIEELYINLKIGFLVHQFGIEKCEKIFSEWERSLLLHITGGCMRRFACRNFQITTIVDSKLSYTPCYMQCGFKPKMLIREMNLFVLFLWEGNFKFDYLYK